MATLSESGKNPSSSVQIMFFAPTSFKNNLYPLLVGILPIWIITSGLCSFTQVLLKMCSPEEIITQSLVCGPLRKLEAGSATTGHPVTLPNSDILLHVVESVSIGPTTINPFSYSKNFSNSETSTSRVISK